MNIRKIILAFALTVLSSSLYAGTVTQVPVEIDFEDRFALGDMATARFSDNDDEFIGCGVRHIQVGEGEIFIFAFCQAGMAGGEGGVITCTTFDPALAAAVDAISDYSFITFSWNEENECTRIGSSTQSVYIPNFKVKKAK